MKIFNLFFRSLQLGLEVPPLFVHYGHDFFNVLLTQPGLFLRSKLILRIDNLIVVSKLEKDKGGGKVFKYTIPFLNKAKIQSGGFS
ncbi:hypothetical protein [Thermococcus sp.]|uniref:Uncharacterized protein n=1 Tax=Thermococcus sibiricus (strain DSM 12597 / MM 739) TaxID=604354 RepID=C6A3I7_THESM|nr:hypothetical protein [Thermococcus sp.]ACS90182.1 hypothetical protein TSIB_1128 [Thermococcus sibiricus MM 739]